VLTLFKSKEFFQHNESSIFKELYYKDNKKADAETSAPSTITIIFMRIKILT